MYIERCKHGLGRGWSKPTAERQQGDSYLLYFREPRSQQTAAKGKRSYSQITNAMIANVLEYGRKGQEPKPFLAPAKKAGKKDTMSKMESVLREEIDKV